MVDAEMFLALASIEGDDPRKNKKHMHTQHSLPCLHTRGYKCLESVLRFCHDLSITHW